MARTTIDQLVLEDHAKNRYLWDEYWKAPTAEMKQQLAYHQIRETSMHASKEEEVLYPVVKNLFGEGEFDRLVADDQELQRILSKMDKLDAHTQLEELDATMKAFQDIYEEHMQHEEKEVLPALLKDPSVDPVELGARFERAAAYAVTRPHPWAPRSPPLASIAKTIAAPIDQVRDYIRFVGSIPTVNPAGAH